MLPPASFRALAQVMIRKAAQKQHVWTCSEGINNDLCGEIFGVWSEIWGALASDTGGAMALIGVFVPDRHHRCLTQSRKWVL